MIYGIERGKIGKIVKFNRRELAEDWVTAWEAWDRETFRFVKVDAPRSIYKMPRHWRRRTTDGDSLRAQIMRDGEEIRK